MKITVRNNNGSSQVNFQPENEEEGILLDKLLNFKGNAIPLTEVEGSVRVAGEIGGHESQRWIIIKREDAFRTVDMTHLRKCAGDPILVKYYIEKDVILVRIQSGTISVTFPFNPDDIRSLVEHRNFHIVSEQLLLDPVSFAQIICDNAPRA